MTRGAVETLQIYLDEVAGTVLRRDFDGYRTYMCMPFQIVAHDSSLTFTCWDDLRLNFERFADTLRSQHVSDYLRLVDGAEYLDDTLLTGRYTTHMMAGALRILPPFRSHITLRREDGQWRAAAITNALSTSRWPLLVISPNPDAPPKGP